MHNPGTYYMHAMYTLSALFVMFFNSYTMYTIADHPRVYPVNMYSTVPELNSTESVSPRASQDTFCKQHSVMYTCILYSPYSYIAIVLWLCCDSPTIASLLVLPLYTLVDVWANLASIVHAEFFFAASICDLTQAKVSSPPHNTKGFVVLLIQLYSKVVLAW